MVENVGQVRVVYKCLLTTGMYARLSLCVCVCVNENDRVKECYAEMNEGRNDMYVSKEKEKKESICGAQC
jgi:hypothetical protein